MSGLLLTLDLGNSRAKLRWWSLERQGGERTPIHFLDLEASAFDSPRLLDALGRFPLLRSALSSVASSERTAAWRRALETPAGEPIDDPACSISNRCREPERVGRDRLFAALGAATVVGAACLVVDAGTALTVDAVEVGPQGTAFVGGAIAPGPGLLARALAGGTANLPHIEPRPGVPALGRVTEEALASGVAIGFRGAAAELVREIGREAELTDAAVVLTGGARHFLLEPRSFVPGQLLVVPELVHLGLLEVLEAALGDRVR